MFNLVASSRPRVRHQLWRQSSLFQAWFRMNPCVRHASTVSKSTNPTSDNTLDLPKPKPKSTTPLRRSASDSLPIRTASPGSEIRPVVTLATAERYLFGRLRNNPDLPPLSRTIHDSWWIPKWGPPNREGEIFVFSNGTFVCWGLEEADALRFKSEILDKTPGFQVGPVKEIEAEELECIQDPSQTTRLQGDLIVLGKSIEISEDETTPRSLPPTAFSLDTLLARYAFSQALSRSTALSVLEVALDDYLSSMAQLPLSLQQTGKPGMGRKALIKKLGELMRFRQGLNLNRENFSDVPDLYWGEPGLERLFNSLSSALEVKPRTKAVNDKIDYSAELQSTLRQLLTESSSHRMELVIIALIAFECTIAIIRDGPELWHMFSGEESEPEVKLA